jgi:hypothetical protein
VGLRSGLPSQLNIWTQIGNPVAQLSPSKFGNQEPDQGLTGTGLEFEGNIVSVAGRFGVFAK